MKVLSRLSVIPIALMFLHGLPAQTVQSIAPPAGQNSSTGIQPVPPQSEVISAAPPALASALTRVSAGDVLEINVYGAPDLGQRVRIDNAGNVYLPLLDYVHLDNLSVEKAQELLEQKYKDGGFLVNPHVSITIVESVSGVSIRGQVAKPGVYPILGSAGLLDIISAAGGLTPDAGNVITITHHDHPDQPETITLSDDPVKNQKANVPAYQGDTVLVPKAGIVYVVGEVQAPAGIALMKDTSITATKALAIVHGPGNNASLNGTFIIRKTPDGRQQNISVPLGKILKAKAPDVTLQAEDILYVPNSTAKAVAKRSADAAIALATSATIIALDH
jgi:polysaccharide export outer membrane protein